MKSFNFAFLVMITIACFSFLSCSKPHYYKSNGVSYFEKPDKELSGFIRFKDPDELNYTCTDGVYADATLYIATNSTKGKAPNETSRIAIYAIDTNKSTIIDSLIVNEKDGISGFKPVVVDDSLVFVSLKWKNDKGNLYIIKSDKSLKTYQVYNYEVPGMSVENAVLNGNKLNILMVSDKKESQLIQIDAETMKLMESYILSESPICSYLDNEYAYSVEKMNDSITIKKYSLLKPKTPELKTTLEIVIQSEMNTQERGYKAYVDGDNCYILLRKSRTLSGQGENLFTIVKINMKDKSFVKNSFPGNTFDMLKIDNRCIVFKSEFKQSHEQYVKYLVPSIVEIDESLVAEKVLLTYIPSEWNDAFKILSINNNRVAMIGSYQYFIGKTTQNVFAPFVAFYDLD